MLKTLVYADIFDYPLTVSELDRWLIAGDDLKVRPTKESAEGAVYPKGGSDLIGITGPYYHLRGRKHLVVLRHHRHKFSQLKYKLAEKITKILSLIPWIRLITVTGALAMNNADEKDDIDLMIVTQKNRLWLTRFMVLVVLLLAGRLRRFGQRGNRDKICLNLWLDETALSVPKTQRNLYTAHEVAQAKPIFSRHNTYRQFIKANLWLKQYLPNFSSRSDLNRNSRLQAEKGSPAGERSDLIGWLERLAFKVQHAYMRKKMTRERVGSHFAFFHPRPTGEIIMDQYQQRLSRSDLKGGKGRSLTGDLAESQVGTAKPEGASLLENAKPIKVLATGVFDVLHSEHKKFLKAAKKQGDILWVGLETDARVRKLKGPGRPVNPLTIRLQNLRQLKIADKVFALPEKFSSSADHRALIKRIGPDILAVSAHSPNLVAKKKIMEDLGGRLRIVLPKNPKISTTKLLQSKP
jgi:cytidyltransferase-like protein